MLLNHLSVLLLVGTGYLRLAMEKYAMMEIQIQMMDVISVLLNFTGNVTFQALPFAMGFVEI